MKPSLKKTYLEELINHEELVDRITQASKTFIIGGSGGIAGYLIGKYLFFAEGKMEYVSTFMGTFLALSHNSLQDDKESETKDKYK